MTVHEIDIERLKTTCLLDVHSFVKMAEESKWEVGGNFNKYLYLRTGKSKVLGVAHLDVSANLPNEFDMAPINGQDETKLYAWTARGDDRAGVYVLMYYLYKYGVQYDILLTTGEETGQTSARQFKTDVPYNWIFEFDRRGDDVVMYEYERSKLGKGEFFNKLLSLYGFKLGTGSFSDVGALTFLDIIGFNFGVGYEQEHTKDSYIDLEVMKSQVVKFVRFYKSFVDIKLPYEREYTYSYQTPSTKGVIIRTQQPPTVSGDSKPPNGDSKVDWRYWRRRGWACKCAYNNLRGAKEQRCNKCGATKYEYIAENGSMIPDIGESDNENIALTLDPDWVAFRDVVRSALVLGASDTYYINTVLPFLSRLETEEAPEVLTYRLRTRMAAMREGYDTGMTMAEVTDIIDDHTGRLEFVAGQLHEEGLDVLRALTKEVDFAKEPKDSTTIISNIRIIMNLMTEQDLKDMAGVFHSFKISGHGVLPSEVAKLLEVIRAGKNWMEVELWLNEGVKSLIKSADSDQPASESAPTTELSKSTDSQPTATNLPSTQPLESPTPPKNTGQ